MGSTFWGLKNSKGDKFIYEVNHSAQEVISIEKHTNGEVVDCDVSISYDEVEYLFLKGDASNVAYSSNKHDIIKHLKQI